MFLREFTLNNLYPHQYEWIFWRFQLLVTGSLRIMHEHRAGSSKTIAASLLHLQNGACFFGGVLFGSFFAEAGAAAYGFVVDHHLRDELFVVVFPFHLHDFEFHIFVFLMRPFDDLAFVVGVVLDDVVDIEVGFYKFFDDEFAAEGVSPVEVNRADESFEGVAIKGFVGKGAFAVVVVGDDFGHADFFCKVVKAFPVYDAGPDFGEEPFGFVGIFFEEKFGRNKAQNGVAKIFKPVVRLFESVVGLGDGAVNHGKSEKGKI